MSTETKMGGKSFLDGIRLRLMYRWAKKFCPTNHANMIKRNVEGKNRYIFYIEGDDGLRVLHEDLDKFLDSPWRKKGGRR